MPKTLRLERIIVPWPSVTPWHLISLWQWANGSSGGQTFLWSRTMEK